MSLPVLIAVVWVGASFLATAAFIAHQMLSHYLWERKQRRAMWREVSDLLGTTRLPT